MSRADSPLRGRMIFNVGARRSGTFWLQRIVTAHPEVAAVPSETHLFSHGIAPLFERFQHTLRASPEVGKVYAERERILDAARDLCDAVFAPMLEPGTSRIAERTPMHVFHLSLIAAIYPDARFVHIIRDGRDVARSLAAQRWGPHGIEEAAREWRDAVLAARRAGLSSDAYHELRYEALLQTPGAAVSDLYEWLGVRVDDEVIAEAVSEAGIRANVGDATRLGAGKWQESYSRSQLAAFDRVAGGLLRELGYPRAAEATVLRARPRRLQGRIAASGTRAVQLVSRAGPRRSAAQPRELLRRVEAVVGSLQDRSLERLSVHMDAGAVVRVVTPSGTEQAHGERGRDLLRRVLEGDSAFAGRQVRGDIFLGDPYSSVVLGYQDDQTFAARTIFVRVTDGQIAELVVYSL